MSRPSTRWPAANRDYVKLLVAHFVCSPMLVSSLAKACLNYARALSPALRSRAVKCRSEGAW